MNVLIIGGTGFVGRAMRAAAPKDARVSIYTRHEGTLAGDWTHIVHAAGTHPWPGTVSADISITGQVKALQRGTGARLLLVSSGAAGEPNIYGATKALQEAMCAGAVIARLYSLISRELPTNHAVRQFIDAGRNGDRLTITGTGEAVRSYLHPTEMARYLWRHLLHSPSGVYEVGSCVPTTILELAEYVAGCCHVDIDVIGGDDGPRKVYLPKVGFLPEMTWQEAVRREL